MIFSMNFLFLHVFPLVLISFLSISPKHPKFQALVKGRMTGAGSCWPCQGVRKPRKGTTRCLSTWQTNPSFGDEKNNTLQPKTACALLFLNNGRFLLFLLGHDMPQHLLLRRFLFFSLFFSFKGCMTSKKRPGDVSFSQGFMVHVMLNAKGSACSWFMHAWKMLLGIYHEK